jgi:hypothetical protein
VSTRAHQSANPMLRRVQSKRTHSTRLHLGKAHRHETHRRRRTGKYVDRESIERNKRWCALDGYTVQRATYGLFSVSGFVTHKRHSYILPSLIQKTKKELQSPSSFREFDLKRWLTRTKSQCASSSTFTRVIAMNSLE